MFSLFVPVSMLVNVWVFVCLLNYEQAACLVAGVPYTPRSGLSSTDDEWCGLTSDDVMHLVSDCEDVAEEVPRGVRTAAQSVCGQQQSHLSASSRQSRNTGQKQTDAKLCSFASTTRRPSNTQPIPPLKRCSVSPGGCVEARDVPLRPSGAAQGTPRDMPQGLEIAGEKATGVRRSARTAKKSRQLFP